MLSLFFDSEDGGNVFFRNVSKLLLDITTSHSKRSYTSLITCVHKKLPFCSHCLLEDTCSSETSVDFTGLRDVISHKTEAVNIFYCLPPIINYFINILLRCRKGTIKFATDIKSLWIANIIFFNSHSGGWSLNWVHSARRPLNGLLYLPRVIMMMENLVEWRLAGETEVLGENLPQRHFVHHKSHLIRPGFEPGPPRWGASD
jgi:hypothetical protein